MLLRKSTLIAIFVVFIILSTNAYSADWIEDTVKSVAVRWGNGCVHLTGGTAVKLDLETAAGRAEFALALTAKQTRQTVAIYQTDDPLQGGCNTGSTIRSHSMFVLIDK